MRHSITGLNDASPVPRIRDIRQDLPAYDAGDLTQGGDQALIVLGDQVYSLRITRAGKLILTK